MSRLAALALLTAASALPARADDPARRGLDPDPARPALGVEGQLTTEGGRLAPPGSWWMGVELDWVHGLLALKRGDERAGWAVADRLAGHLLGARSFGRLELGAGLPVALWQRSDLAALSTSGASGRLTEKVASGALGDLRLSGRAALLDEERAPLSLAAQLELRAPTGDGRAFFSDGWGVTPGLAAGRRAGPWRVDGTVGYAFRPPGQFLQLVAHDGMAFGAAVSRDLAPFWRVLEARAIVDLSGQVPRGFDANGQRYRAPLSVRAGVRARIWRALWVDLGAGTGLAPPGEAGYGRESFRLFAGLRWQRIARDRDGDGVPDDEDRCPDVPGPRSNQGCPGPADRDGDGVPDAEDRCPDVPGPRELEGCPDQDGDGIPDLDDLCPTVPGPAQNDGCPPPPEEPVVEIETTRLSLKDAIHFDTGKDTIKPESGHILDEIAKVLGAHSEIARIRVEGHTDTVGSRAYNQDLSQRRAASVARALVSRGVPAVRLTPVGYGFDRPVASNATALGRAKNRRVEFTILGESDAPGAAPPREGR